MAFAKAYLTTREYAASIILCSSVMASTFSHALRENLVRGTTQGTMKSSVHCGAVRTSLSVAAEFLSKQLAVVKNVPELSN